MADPRIKDLKIKSGVVKRLTKERQCYEKEAENQAKKLEKLKSEEGDEYVIRKAAEVLQETKQMVPDCQRRLKSAMTDLSKIIESFETKEEEDPEELKTAKVVLCDAETSLK